MSLRSAVLEGRQSPRLALVPAAEWSHADDAAFLSSSYGLTPDDWQFDVLAAWLGARRNGRWAATTCGLAVPRQNGKNGILEIRELYGMVALGEKFLHTAHEVKTARKAFLRLKSFFEDERKYPELAALAVEIRKTNGQEAIVLENGGSVEFVARSKGSGRGFTVDVLVCDEAQELSDEALEALGSTISAAPTQNPQTIFTGTPPGPTMNGEVFTRTRAAAIAGKSPRLSWHEWSLAKVGDLDDRALWADTNPALGRRLNIEVIEDERDRYSDDGFARERLGVWSDTIDAGRAIQAAAWKELAALGYRPFTASAFAVEVDPDREWSAIAAASPFCTCTPPVEPCDSDIRHLDVVEHGRDTDWVVASCVELGAKYPGTPFVVDKRSPADSLIDGLRTSGLRVVTVDTLQVAQAYGLFMDALKAGRLRHSAAPGLEAAVKVAKTRPCGDGGQAFGRKVSGADITALVAASFAHWAAVTAPKVNVLQSIW